MQINAPDIALLPAQVATQVRLNVGASLRIPMMNFVAFDFTHRVAYDGNLALHRDLLRPESRFDIQQAHAHPITSFDPVGIVNVLPQHLQAAANPKNGNATRCCTADLSS